MRILREEGLAILASWMSHGTKYARLLRVCGGLEGSYLIPATSILKFRVRSTGSSLSPSVLTSNSVSFHLYLVCFTEYAVELMEETYL